MKLTKDLQGDSHNFAKLSLNKVGIINVVKRVDIVRGNYSYSFTPSISALINLPEKQRGIHMSRSAETIEEVINEVIIKPTRSVEELCLRMVKSLLEYHDYANRVEVDMDGSLIVQRALEDGNAASQKNYRLHGKAIGLRNDGTITYRAFVGASADGMTACPCALELSRAYAKDLMQSRKELHLDPDQIQTLLNILPYSSHNQRATGTVILEVGPDPSKSIDVIKLIDLIEESMSAKLKTVLKRPQEAAIVRTAHLNPLFAEDVVRIMGTKLAGKDFAQLADENTVTVKIESYESIHTHNVYAELDMTLGEIRRAVAEHQENFVI